MFNLFEIWTKVSGAMEQGKALADASTWANRAGATQALLVILMAGVSVANAFGLNLNVSGTDMSAVAQGIAVIGFWITSRIQTAANPYAGKVPKK